VDWSGNGFASYLAVTVARVEHGGLIVDELP
jgi:hypothetical protein